MFEATKRGEPHLHILCRVKWISQKWLSDQMRALTNSPVVDIRQVKGKRQVAHYVSKYVGKEPHRFATCKRYWSTRSWRLPEPPGQPYLNEWTEQWFTSDKPLWMLERDWKALGYEVTRDKRMVTARKDPPAGEWRVDFVHV